MVCKDVDHIVVRSMPQNNMTDAIAISILDHSVTIAFEVSQLYLYLTFIFLFYHSL